MTKGSPARPYRQGCPDANTCACACFNCERGEHCVRHFNNCHMACNK